MMLLKLFCGRGSLQSFVTWDNAYADYPRKGPVIIYVEVGEGEKKGGGGGGGQGYFRLARGGGGGLNFFIKKFRGGQQFEVYSIVRGVHWPRWVKQLNSRVQTLSVKKYC